MKKCLSILIMLTLGIAACNKYEEHSHEDFEAFGIQGITELLERTVSKPWRGEAFVPGRLGGTWHTVINQDPKSFNHLTAEQDSVTNLIVSRMTDPLITYNVVRREWVPHIATFVIVEDKANDKLQVIYTLRDDVYWSYYNSERKVKVTSDDIIFWYDEIEGDPAFNSSGYTGQFLTMPDGSTARKTITKIDDRSFSFNFPRIIAEPLLSSNLDFGPRHVFEEAKKTGGVDAVRNLYSVAVNPKTIPSMGGWFLTEYTPSQRLVYTRNPDYWRKDSNGLSIPYFNELIMRIIPEENTQLLLFNNGETESYNLRPEDIGALVNRGSDNFTVFNSEGSLSASFWTFNQNPVNSKKSQFQWFTQKEFRQAMSCLLNRDRINTQVYRGLAEPKLTIFPEPNPFYNPNITLRYLYDRERALELLASIGISQDRRGVMRDSRNKRIEFNLTIRSESTMQQDIASIIRDELSQVGIKVNIRVLDFQKQVKQLFETFDWDSMLMGLSGSGIFPSQGSNVWPSSGNLHMWYPNQETPATEWEARIDYLYNEGQYTLDSEAARAYWDEFQEILLEQSPMIYLMRSRGFWALNNRWDFSNVYYDNTNGTETDFVFLK
ncbi:MAG: ABC transporter substrate-binding protein [Treponema sp.]|nr:ABC transporter substrate-binding protein [Treponema sp.]MCL2236643.1 ABC transporter substrate-binding protein [Treponema sp.]